MKIPFNYSLAGRIFGTLLLVAVVPLMIYIAIALPASSKTIVGAIENSLKNQCVLVANDLDRFIEQRVVAARLLSQGDTLEGSDVKKIQQYLVEVSDADPDIFALYVVSLTGHPIASSRSSVDSGGGALKNSVLEQSGLVAMCVNAKQGEVFVSEAMQLSTGNGLLLATPITDDANEFVIKLLFVEIDMSQIQAIVSQFGDSVLGDKFVYVVDNAGRVVTTGESKVGFLERFRDLDVQPDLAQKFSNQGEVGHLLYRDSEGDEVVAAYADLSEFGVNGALDWSIIAIAPVEAILAPARTMRNWLLGVGSIVTLVSLALGWYLSDSLLEPLRRIQSAAEQIRQGHYDHHLPASGLAEIDSISQAFLAMTRGIAERENQIVDSESRYRSLFESMTSGFVLFEAIFDDKGVPVDLVIVTANQRFATTTGLKIPDCIGKRLTQVLPGIENDAADWIATYAKIAITGTPLQFEQGSEHLGMYYSIAAYQAAPKQCAVIFLDISDLKNAEKGLRQNERMVSSSQDMMALLDSEFTYVAVNDAYTSAFGKVPNELVGRTVSEVFGQEFFDSAIRPHAERCLAGEELRYQEQFEFPIHGSRHMDVAYSPYKNKNNQIAGFVVCARNVSAQKIAENELRESHMRLKRVLDGIFVFVGLIDLNGELIEINRAPLDAVGVEKESVIGKPLISSPWFADYPQSQRQLKETFQRCESGEAVRGELSIRLANGQTMVADTVFTPLRDDSGRVVEIVGSAVDITERISVERKLKRLNADLELRVQRRTAELQRTNEDLEAYAHSVAHDLRAPLRAMFGFAQALREDYADQLDVAGREFIDFIESAAHQMDDLTSDLLEYSKVGSKEVSNVVVNLDDVVKRALKRLEAEVAEHNPTLHIETPLGIVIGHHSTLIQVVSNLLSNAMKFLPEGKKAEVRIWNEIRDDSNRLWIEDNGIGIAVNFYAKIFGVFERLHGIETYPGTGIGLAIVRRAVESMGGRFGLESSLGEGSRFWVEFPLSVKP